jgi:hypothetical protein
MVFAKRLREGVIRGQITSSIRIWTSPHVKVGNRYRMGFQRPSKTRIALSRGRRSHSASLKPVYP